MRELMIASAHSSLDGRTARGSARLGPENVKALLSLISAPLFYDGVAGRRCGSF